MGRYFVGPQPAVKSALGAVQAAALVGEQLGKEPAELEEFLREFTGAAPATEERGEAPRLERA